MAQFSTIHMTTLLYDISEKHPFLIQFDRDSPSSEYAFVSFVDRQTTAPVAIPPGVSLTNEHGDTIEPIAGKSAFRIQCGKSYKLLQDWYSEYGDAGKSVLLRLRPMTGWHIS